MVDVRSQMAECRKVSGQARRVILGACSECLSSGRDGSISTDSSVAALAGAVRDCESVFWLDMLKPTDEEYVAAGRGVRVPPAGDRGLDQVRRSGRRSRATSTSATRARQGYFYMVFHGPDLETFKEKLRTKELDMFVSERYLVTIHEEEMQIDRATCCSGRAPTRGWCWIRGSTCCCTTSSTGSRTRTCRSSTTSGSSWTTWRSGRCDEPTPDVLTRSRGKKRELLNLRRIVGPQREVVAQLTRGEVPFIRDGDAALYFRDVQDHLIRTVETVELYRDLVLGARDIYLSSI